MQEGGACYDSKQALHASSRMFVAAGSCRGGGKKGSFLQSTRFKHLGPVQHGSSGFGKAPSSTLRTNNKALPVREFPVNTSSLMVRSRQSSNNCTVGVSAYTAITYG